MTAAPERRPLVMTLPVFPSWMLLRRLLLRPLQYILMFRITFGEDTL